MGDAEFVQLLCALRLVLPDTGITLSTREDEHLRDALLPLGVTLVSAGSHTEPGGYAAPIRRRAAVLRERHALARRGRRRHPRRRLRPGLEGLAAQLEAN